jgi:hypothetical protein
MPMLVHLVDVILTAFASVGVHLQHLQEMALIAHARLDTLMMVSMHSAR